jgi:phytoene dehydrogenase-like protein
MGAIPQQVAADLPQNKIRLNTPVLAVSAGITGAAAPVGVVLDLGSKQAVNARAAVIAADPLAASKLLGNRLPPFPAGRASTCLYFSLPAPPPVSDPLLILNGEPTSPTAPVNNLVFLDSIAPSYAPLGRSLASVTVVGNPAESDETLADACLRQISR